MSTMFARYVQDKRQRRPLLYVSLVVAGVIEGAVLAYFFVSFLLKVTELTPPPLITMLVSIKPLLPPLEPHITDRDGRQQRPPKVHGSRLRQPNLKAQPTQQNSAPTALVEPNGPPGDDNDGPIIPGDDIPKGPIAPPLPPPDPPPQPPKKVPQFLIKKQQLFGPDPHLPQVVKQQRRGQTVTGTYLVCIDKSGHVSDVNTLTGIPGADAEIANTLRTWLYKEQPIPVCFAQHFEFIVE